MKHSFGHSHRHAHLQREKNYKVLKHIDDNHKIMIEIEEVGGYLIEEGDPFLEVRDVHITRKVYTMEKILEYCKESLSEILYLDVEKFFMERET